MNVLSSLDRSGTGVAASNIDVAKQDLGTGKQTMGTTAVTATDYLSGAGGAVTGTTAQTITFNDTGVKAAGTAAGTSYRITLSAPLTTTTSVGEGRGTNTATTGLYEYVARDGDTMADVANALKSQIENGGAKGISITTKANATDANDVDFSIKIDSGLATDGITTAFAAFTGGKVGGGLYDVSTIDVTTSAGAEKALKSVEGLIQTSIELGIGIRFGPGPHRNAG